MGKITKLHDFYFRSKSLIDYFFVDQKYRYDENFIYTMFLNSDEITVCLVLLEDIEIKSEDVFRVEIPFHSISDPNFPTERMEQIEFLLSKIRSKLDKILEENKAKVETII